MPDLLFELGCEEIPARFLPEATRQLKERGENLLKRTGFSYTKIFSWSTPRRLVLYLQDLYFEESKAFTLVKGPLLAISYDEEGKPTPALNGFLRKVGVTPEQIIVQDGYVYAKKRAEITPAEKLTRILEEAISGLSFPKLMRWGAGEHVFVRPVRWICALWGEEVLPLNIFGLEARRFTRGLRFFSSELPLEKPSDYEALLEENFVLVNQEKRAERLEIICSELAQSIGGSPLWDEDFKEELLFLLEYPTPFLGTFPEDYLTLPKEVIRTVMRRHQKQLPIVDPSGNLLPFFICFRNGPALGEEIIIRGNEQALLGRVEDARLFFNKDLSKPLIQRVEELKGILFHEKLGSLQEKTQRVQMISQALADRLQLPNSQKESCLKVAFLCKADLATSLVQELPELQGIIGREYALLQGEPEEIAKGIAEHYLPRFPGDKLPEGILGTIVGLADRLDTLITFFAIGLEPTGSSDPFALRRIAGGLVSILMKRDFPISLEELISLASPTVSQLVPLSKEQEAHLVDFIKERARFALEEQGISYEIASVLLAAQPLFFHELEEKALLLKDIYGSEELKKLVFSYKRIKNILRSAPSFQSQLIEEGMEKAERDLYLKLQESWKGSCAPRDLLQKLLSLTDYVENFFEKIMVMVEEKTRRESRLTLLQNVLIFYNRFGDFSQLPF